MAKIKTACFLLLEKRFNILQMKNTEHKDISLDRIIFFSDAVFAIAITLLALEIRLPEHTGSLREAFPEMLPKVFAYVFGYLQIAIFWSAHHTLFKKLADYDNAIIWLNLIFLMVIAFLPVPIAAMIETGITGDSIAFMYSCLVLLGIVEWLIWRYMSNPVRKLLPASLSKDQRAIEGKKIFYLIMLFLVGIPLGYIAPHAAFFIGVLMPIIHRRIERRG